MFSKVLDNLRLTRDFYLLLFHRSVISNYLGWSLVQSLTSCLSKPFREASKILRKALVGSEGGESPWRYCVSDTNEVIGFALGAMFVREVFHGESKPMVSWHFVSKWHKYPWFLNYRQTRSKFSHCNLRNFYLLHFYKFKSKFNKIFNKKFVLLKYERTVSETYSEICRIISHSSLYVLCAHRKRLCWHQ